MAVTLKDRLARQASGIGEVSFNIAGSEEPQLVLLPLSVIDPDPNQPRQHIGNLNGLADSIQEYGVLQPIIVEALSTGRYRILAGERRYAACKNLNLETVPCLVRTVVEQSRLTLQIIENIQRQDLHPVEEARAFQRLIDDFNLTQRDLALRLGKSLPDINQTLRILDLGEDTLAKIQESEHATKSLLLEIAKQANPDQQRVMLEKMLTGELTVSIAKATNRPKQLAKSRELVCTIPLVGATITIRFQTGSLTLERIVTALHQAEASYRTLNATAKL